MNNTQIFLKERSLSIDMVKGLSILTLFFLHFENGWISPEYNYLIVRSPAFYIVIGWLWGMSSNKKTIKGHWIKRKEGLVKPYLWLSLIFLCLDAIMVMLQLIEPIIIGRDLCKTILLRGIGTLWFLPALLGGEVLFIFFRDKNKTIKIGAYIISLVIIFLFYKYGYLQIIKNKNLDFASHCIFNVLKDISNAFIYISIAYFISINYGKKIFHTKKAYLFITGIILLIIAFFGMNFPITILNTEIKIAIGVFTFIFYNCCSGFGILFLFRSLEWFKFLSLPLAYCGKNSLTIMAFHFCFLFQITLVIDKNLLGNTTYYGDRTIIYFIVALILQIAIIEIINKKFKYIIGKN